MGDRHGQGQSNGAGAEVHPEQRIVQGRLAGLYLRSGTRGRLEERDLGLSALIVIGLDVKISKTVHRCVFLPNIAALNQLDPD